MSEDILDHEIISSLRTIGKSSPKKDFFGDLLKIFERQGYDLIEGIREANQQKNLNMLFHSAHKLKGSSKCIGAAKLTSYCKELQNLSENTEYPLQRCLELEESILESFRLSLKELKSIHLQ
ncbi:MAG: Hpt domain-containing protein [Pseudobacteriovorax sp.]|nr:Hpt domain-containing protein [Pseudobacteriovorax sp.]